MNNMNKQELMSQIESGRDEFEAVLKSVPVDRVDSLKLPNCWTPKDVAAHLGAWEQRTAEILEALLGGDQPLEPIADGPEMDAYNAQVYERNRLVHSEVVLAAERSAYQRLLSLVAKASEGDLFDAQRFAWTQGVAFVQWVLGNTSEHYQEHLPELRQVLSELGR
jgi:hypothetical protein